jgi:hypothetical protein
MPNMFGVSGAQNGSRGNTVPHLIIGNDSYTKLLVNFEGSSATDLSTRNHTLTLMESAESAVSNKAFGKKSLYSNGNGYIKISDNMADFRFTSSEEFTIETRFSATTAQDQPLFCCYDPATEGWALYYQNSDSKFYLKANGSTVLSCSYSITLGKWYHVALVGTGTQIKLFVNGVSQATVSQVDL